MKKISLRALSLVLALLLLTMLVVGAFKNAILPATETAKKADTNASYAISDMLVEKGYTTIYSGWNQCEDIAIASEGRITAGFWNSSKDVFRPVMYLCDPSIYEVDSTKCVYYLRKDNKDIALKKAQERGVTMTLVACALEALANGDDFAAVHVEAPDEMAHAGDLAKKLEAIQNVEYRVVAPILSEMHKRGEDFRLLLLPDHPTLLTTRTHDGSPVPYAVYDSRFVTKTINEGKPMPTRKFCEEEMKSEPVLMDGTDLMRVLFEQI